MSEFIPVLAKGKMSTYRGKKKKNFVRKTLLLTAWHKEFCSIKLLINFNQRHLIWTTKYIQISTIIRRFGICAHLSRMSNFNSFFGFGESYFLDESTKILIILGILYFSCSCVAMPHTVASYVWWPPSTLVRCQCFRY